MRFDPSGARFELVLDASSLADGPTEIAAPAVHYPDGVVVEVSAGEAVFDPATRLVCWTLAAPGAEARLTMRPA